MEVNLDRDTLILALSRAQGFTATKTTTNPALRCVRLATISDGRLKVDATDTTISLSAVYPTSTVTRNGEALVELAPFLDMIKLAPKGGIWLSVNSGLRMAIRPDGHLKPMYTLVSLDPNDFPPIEPKKATSGVLVIDGDALNRMIREVEFSISDDANRYGFNGAYVESIKGATMRFASTDGNRLSYSEAPIKGTLAWPKHGLIPLRGLSEMSRVVGKGDWTIHTGGDSRFMRVSAPDVDILIRLIEGEFPDYRQVLPPPNAPGYLLRVARSDFIETVRRTDMIAAKDRHHTTRIEIAADAVVLSAESVDLGDCAIDLPCERVTDPKVTDPNHRHRTGFNIAFIADILRATPDAKSYLWHIAEGALDPSTIRVEDRNDANFIVMPMRLD